MTIEKAEQNIRQALKDYGRHTSQKDILCDVTESFITRLARDSVKAKADLRELFSKSPVWNPELDALVINGTRTHDPDPDRICELGRQILAPVRMRSDYDMREKINNAILYFLPTLSDCDRAYYLSCLQDVAPKAYAPGKKPSRIFKALCQELGVADETQGSEFQRLYAQFADELTSRKLDFKLYVSINPAHFITMSNPKCDNRGSTLTSCHSFNNTQYSYNCGCSGYARDKVTFIAFTVDNPNNPESFNNRKTTRQIFAYRPGSGLLLQSRMYNTSGGVYGADKDSKLYRDLIQREISTLEYVPNLWRTYHSYDSEYCDYVEQGAGFGGYADWIHDDFDGHISFRADCNMDEVKPLVVGTYGLCVKCGDEISEGMYCDDCACAETCDDCDCGCHETFLVYSPNGSSRYVCENCRERNYTFCDRCEEYCDNEGMTRVGDNCYCDDCLRVVATECDDCGEWVMNEDSYKVYDSDGLENWVCENCRDDYQTCPHCGELIVLRNDGTCPHCGAVVEEKEEDAV